MSIQLSVYTALVSPLTATDLHRDALAAGWDVNFVEDVGTLSSVNALEDCYVIGSEADAPDAAALRNALRSHDRAHVEAAYAEEAVGVVAVTIRPAVALTADELTGWQRRGVATSLVGRRQHARVCYILETTANRNELSAELQHELWLLIGVLTDGVCVDDTEGTVIDAASGE